MEYRVEVNGTPRTVHVRRDDGRFIVAIGTRQWTVDAERLGSDALSLLIADRDPSGHAAGASSAPVVSREAFIAGVPGEPGRMVVSVGTVAVPVGIDGQRRWNGGRAAVADSTGPQRLTAPMPGRVVRVLAQPGALVAARQAVVVIEAMKMENELRSPVDGIVSDVLVKEGQSVESGTVLAVVTPQ
ncbi:MAG: biotin/lipoyl-containing protein [Vicinamibacterales bacterium]